MSEHREGTLFYDTETGRYDIRFDLESFYGGLHCGECFDVKVKDVWVPVRIEMGDDWYLVGLVVVKHFCNTLFENSPGISSFKWCFPIIVGMRTDMIVPYVHISV